VIAGNIPGEHIKPESALLSPGTKDHEVILVRRDGKVLVFEWQTEASEWACLGEAVGAAAGDQAEQSKKVS
jgi:hypothetical protein